jgi:hypothetical protein
MHGETVKLSEQLQMEQHKHVPLAGLQPLLQHLSEQILYDSLEYEIISI